MLKTTRRNGSRLVDRCLPKAVDLLIQHHTVTALEFAQLMDFTDKHASELMTRFEKMGVVYIRYTLHGANHYSLRTEDEVY